MNELIKQLNRTTYEYRFRPDQCFRQLEHRSCRHRSEAEPKRLFEMVVVRLGGILLLIMALSCSSCQAPGKLPAQLIGQTQETLIVGDTVKLSFPGAPEMNQLQKIRADGKISLSEVGEVEAAGKKIGDLQEDLSNQYKSQLNNSEVVVTLEGREIVVYVIGAVKQPGKVLLARPMTMLEAIVEAGGPTEMGNLKKVVLVRNGEGKHYTQTFNISSPLNGRAAASFPLRPFDVINVPERNF